MTEHVEGALEKDDSLDLEDKEEFVRDSDIEWLPTGPSLEQLSWDQYADLLAEVALIEAEASGGTGH